MEWKRRQKCERLIVTKKWLESMNKGGVSLKKEGEKEGKCLQSLSSQSW